MAGNGKLDSNVADLLADFNIKHAAKIVYGEPVEREGITIIPIAKMKYGFGFGFGSNKGSKGEGGGGGALATPLGYLEIHDDNVVFKKIQSISLPTLILILSLSSLFVLHFVKRIFKRP